MSHRLPLAGPDEYVVQSGRECAIMVVGRAIADYNGVRFAVDDPAGMTRMRMYMGRVILTGDLCVATEVTPISNLYFHLTWLLFLPYMSHLGRRQVFPIPQVIQETCHSHGRGRFFNCFDPVRFCC